MLAGYPVCLSSCLSWSFTGPSGSVIPRLACAAAPARVIDLVRVADRWPSQRSSMTLQPLGCGSSRVIPVRDTRKSVVLSSDPPRLRVSSRDIAARVSARCALGSCGPSLLRAPLSSTRRPRRWCPSLFRTASLGVFQRPPPSTSRAVFRRARALLAEDRPPRTMGCRPSPRAAPAVLPSFSGPHHVSFAGLLRPAADLGVRLVQPPSPLSRRRPPPPGADPSELFSSPHSRAASPRPLPSRRHPPPQSSGVSSSRPQRSARPQGLAPSGSPSRPSRVAPARRSDAPMGFHLWTGCRPILLTAPSRRSGADHSAPPRPRRSRSLPEERPTRGCPDRPARLPAAPRPPMPRGCRLRAGARGSDTVPKVCLTSKSWPVSQPRAAFPPLASSRCHRKIGRAHV